MKNKKLKIKKGKLKMRNEKFPREILRISGAGSSESCKDSRGEIKSAKLITLFLAFSLCICFAMSVKSQTENEIEEEILIQVEPNIIAMPKNIEIARVPISAARIRSTELRELNKKYNAVTIERLFKVKEESDEIPLAETKTSLFSKEKKKVESKQFEPAKVFTKSTRKELLTRNQNVEVVEVKDAFLIQLKPDKNFNINQVINEYDALSAVLFVEYYVEQAVAEEQEEKEKKKDK